MGVDPNVGEPGYLIAADTDTEHADADSEPCALLGTEGFDYIDVSWAGTVKSTALKRPREPPQESESGVKDCRHPLWWGFPTARLGGQTYLRAGVTGSVGTRRRRLPEKAKAGLYLRSTNSPEAPIEIFAPLADN